MKITTLITLPLLLMLIGTPVSANYGERWYNVEIILFAHNNEAALQEEHWPEDPGTPDSSNSVSIISHGNSSERLPGQIIEYEKLPITMLASSLSRLKRSGRYRVIHSTAWRLPYLRVNQAPSVRIKAGRRFTDTGQPATAASIQRPTHTEQITAQVAGQSIENQIIDTALYEIDGRIKISLSKYLDVDADLLFRDNVFLPDHEGVPTQTLRSFRLTEYRRMKSKTIHYLDHPMFGMVIGIDRYEPALINRTLGLR